eukprot:TRINITY_DN8576_c0_g1_i2.p1 TRINITY_DN8576_c0_g1~~TRINITY_DN8576_c0_g1_i2.p1  ORF type:complete len:282 (+),score=69.38 TRINITY_DN8576_c0_g1_i2:72-848(+)
MATRRASGSEAPASHQRGPPACAPGGGSSRRPGGAPLRGALRRTPPPAGPRPPGSPEPAVSAASSSPRHQPGPPCSAADLRGPAHSAPPYPSGLPLGVGEESVSIPEPVLRLRELQRLHSDMNAQLRRTHAELEKATSAEQLKRLQSSAEEMVRAVEQISARMTGFTDDLWAIADLVGRHESLQRTLEDVEQRHAALSAQRSADGAAAGTAPAARADQTEAELLDEYEALGAAFDRSYTELSTVLREWHRVHSDEPTR